MRKLSRNFSLPPIKINNNSTQVDIKPFPISKTTNTIISQNPKDPFRNNLLIYIKFLPFNDDENHASLNEFINIKDNKNISLIHPDSKKIFNYNFDYIFDKNVDENTFFEKGIKNLIDDFIGGKNICIYNYNSGKTSILEIMPLILKEIFIKKNLLVDNEYILKYSLFEINNDNIKDLLKFQKEKNKYLCLRKDKEKGIIIEGVTEIIINDNNNILKILEKGNKYINENKYNSSIIFQISFENKSKFNNNYNKLLLIDSPLMNYLINENNNTLTPEEINDIYNSNLNEIKPTQIKNPKLFVFLKNSLLNNSKIIIIANMSSSIKNLKETYNNLNYFNKMKNKIKGENNLCEFNQINDLKNKVNQLEEILKDYKEEGNILIENNKTYRNRNKKKFQSK